MGTWATLLDENDEAVGEWFSKAVFVFCAEALFWYCHRAELSRDELEEHSDLLGWFSDIVKEMQELLCVLSLATEEPWQYTENEYSRYVSELEGWLRRGYRLMSAAEFAANCRAPEDPYVETTMMLQTTRDLLRVVKALRPRETWWYNEEDSWADFEMLAQTLQEAQGQGVQRVRFGYG